MNGKLENTTKMYCVELYNSSDIMIKDWHYKTRDEQQLKYYQLIIEDGCKKKDIVKRSRDFYL